MTPLEKLQGEVESLKTQVDEKDVKIASLEEALRIARHHADVYRRLAYAPKSEKRKKPPGPEATRDGLRQTSLFEEEMKERAKELEEQCQSTVSSETQSSGEAEPSNENKKKNEKRGKRKSRRTRFPSHLPRTRTTIELKPEDRMCCGQVMAEMGEEVTRELEKIELILVHEIARKKYCCRACQGNVQIAPAPNRVIDKGMLSAGFLAHVISDRFADHIPYYRQEKRYATEGLDLSRVVLCKSTLRCSELFEPIYKQLLREIIDDSNIVNTDDTPVTELQSTEGGRRTARFWVYTNKSGKIAYDFTESRGRDGPEKILKDFKGYIQADAYSVYDTFFTAEGAQEVACWAHARRKFIEAESTAPTASSEAVSRIRQLYAIEERAREAKLSAEETLALRTKESIPLLNELEAWMDVAETTVLPKSPLARAISYARKQWAALCRFTECGDLEIDNNRAERAMRAIAVGRKNWLHVIGEAGGKAAATMYSLVQTCKEIGVNPKDYLTDVLTRISQCSDVTTLTPHGWKATWQPIVEDRRQRIINRLS